MTFTYTPISTDRDRMRFHLGDTDADSAKFSDEELDGVLVEYVDYKPAVLACIRSMIARMAQPDFKADWLDVKPSTAVAAWQALLALKAGEFGLSSGRSFGSGVTNVIRADSDMGAWD